MDPETTWRHLADCLRRGDLGGAAEAASALDAFRMRGGDRPDGVPVAAWRVGALRALCRLLVAALEALGPPTG